MSNNRQSSSWVPTNPSYDPSKPMQIGGQAVIEGVMMRAPGSVATAVRRQDGSIAVRKEPYASFGEKYGLSKIPVVRGAVGLVDMMYLGIKTLNFSAEVAMRDNEAAAAKKNGTAAKAGQGRGQSKTALAVTLAIALTVGIAIFFVTPLVLTTMLFDVERTAVAFNVTAGVIRIGILIVYLAAISIMRDVKRLFQYHGAEHKSVFAFELNDALSVASTVRHSRFHPRCGTSFLLVVMFVAILSFALLDALMIGVFGELTLGIRVLTHLPFIPVVGGIAYEFIKFSAKHSATWWGRLIIAPGLWLQKITTKEPDESQLEVALVALRCALGLEDAGRYPLFEHQIVPVLESPSPR
jgi:uncharacterized protein YqhQ